MVDLAKLRAVAKRWAPHAAALIVGTAVGATLTTLSVRAAASLGASKGDLVVIASGVLAVVSANVAVWWMWLRGKDADLRQARREAASWHREAAERREHIAILQQQVAELSAARVTPGEVVSLLHERMGDQP